VPTQDWLAIVVVALDVFVGAYYCTKLIRKEAHPRIATWLIFEIGVLMSLAAYFTSRNHSIVKAALNVTDAVVVTTILTSLLLVERHRRIRLTRNEQLCLLISCISLIAWAATKTAWIAVTGFQIVMSVAYVPTIENLWRWKTGRPPEPIWSWSINALAALIGVLIDLTGTRHDYLAMLYPLRAFIFCMVVVTLLVRWEQKNKTNAALLT
jgi:hypothetical protein